MTRCVKVPTRQSKCRAGGGARELNRENPEGGRFVSADPAMARVVAHAERVAPTGENLLIIGESGTGKEVVAHFVHQRSSRDPGPFVHVNCGELSTLGASRLSGAVKGAYSGAWRDFSGSFEQSEGGTLFLDEIQDAPPEVCGTLMHFVETRETTRLCDARVRPIRTRIIAASNRDLREGVLADRFRLDFYYRLAVHELHVPPLRDRPVDIAALAVHFLGLRKPGASFEPEAMKELQRQHWGGNVRELKNVIARLAVHAGPVITARDVREWSYPEAGVPGREAPARLDAATAAFEREHVLRAIKRCSGDVAVAATELGIGRSTLFRKIAGEHESRI